MRFVSYAFLGVLCAGVVSLYGLVARYSSTLTMDEFGACIYEQEMLTSVQTQKELGRSLFGVNHVPMTVLLDRDREIGYVWRGLTLSLDVLELLEVWYDLPLDRELSSVLEPEQLTNLVEIPGATIDQLAAMGIHDVDPTDRFVLLEYTEVQCPSCRSQNDANTLQAIASSQVFPGVGISYHMYPLNDLTTQAAEALICIHEIHGYEAAMVFLPYLYSVERLTVSAMLGRYQSLFDPVTGELRIPR